MRGGLNRIVSTAGSRSKASSFQMMSTSLN